ncbi:type IV pilus modification PilV family protein [Halochromatium roseum]|uniref:type IV pilus modification PilV family protein n=1 Tax=Halochromatium roseum TaxID=391920 RepID=UPI001913CF0F|nr:hypothetical protein [Halochromatium roseum]
MINLNFFGERVRGFALLDALVTMAILALGMTALATLNGRLVSGGNIAKNRAQAVAIAQKKIEELRANVLNDSGGVATNNFSTLASGSDSCSDNPSPYPCGSAGFQRQWILSDHTAIPNSKNIQVSVTWTDAENQPQSVFLSSLVTWDNPLMQAGAVDDDDFINMGGFPDPTGGGSLQLSNPLDVIGENPTIAKDNQDFNLRVVQYQGGVAVYDPTITNEDQVWLTTDPGVIEITGNVKLSTDDDVPDSAPHNFTNETMYGVLRAIAADAGICREVENKNNTDDDDSDNYLDFLCYVGSNWYGRIGIMAIDADGKMVNIEYYGSGVGNADRLCPHTYRYGSKCDVTGEYILMVSGGQNTYCGGSPLNPDFVPVTTVVINSLSGEPMLYGTLTGQNFVIQDSNIPCFGNLAIYGSITLTGGDSARGIIMNVVEVTPSGATSGCSVFEDADQTTGTYHCSVPTGWTGTVTFTAENCSGAPIDKEYTALSANVNENVSISGCIGDTLLIKGMIANLELAMDPVLVFVDTNDNVIDGVVCDLVGNREGDSVNDPDANYRCDNIPGNSAGKIVVSAENCSEISSSSATYSGDTVNVDIGGWTTSSCQPVEYVVNGFMNKPGNAKWEAGTGGDKVAVSGLVVHFRLEGDATSSTCDTISGLSNQVDSYGYSCSFESYPNTGVVMSVDACGPSAGDLCMIVQSTTDTFVLGNTNPIPGINFNLTPD